MKQLFYPLKNPKTIIPEIVLVEEVFLLQKKQHMNDFEHCISHLWKKRNKNIFVNSFCVCVWVKKHVIASNWVTSANWFTLALLFRLSKSFSTIPGEPDTTDQSQITVLLSCGHSLSALKILEPYWARWESNIWQILTAGKKTKLTFVKFPTVLASPHPSL